MKSVILIAVLALVRKFIILDVHNTTPAMVAALAAAILAPGIVYGTGAEAGAPVIRYRWPATSR